MTSSSNPLVLVADDEPSMLELVAHHLRTMSDPKLEVIQASDGEDAWRLAQQHLPDLVVLDVMMPGMSGWEVCRKIREDIALAHTGVVMLTGIGENLNQMTSPLYGADAYIDKPFEFDDFDDKVRDTLKGREGQRIGVTRPAMNGTAGAAKPAASEAPAKAKTAKRPLGKKAPAKKKAAPAKTAKRPSGKKAAPAKTAKRPSGKKAAPAKTAKRPSGKKAAPAKTAKRPSGKKAAPAKKKAAPSKKKAAAKKKR